MNLAKSSKPLARKDVLELLASSVSYGNLGLFIGAGFSKAVLDDGAGGIALSWPELLEKIAQKMDVNYASINKVGASYPEIASKICAEHSGKDAGAFKNSLRKLKHGIAELTSWYPTQSQRDKFAAYLTSISPSWIITTNYDLVIESLLTGKSIPLGPNDQLSAPKGVVPVFHLHGIRTNPEELIIAQQDYVTLFRPSEYRQIKLALTIKESTTLFLGYGLGDVNVLTALDWSKNVFQGDSQNYPNAVIQVYLNTSNPSEIPYVDNNGIVIIETASLTKFFDEFVVVRKDLELKEKGNQEALASLTNEFNSPDIAIIDRFIDDNDFRETILNALSEFSIYLIAGFVSFLDKCIEKTWERAKPKNAFEAYEQNLTIILDILTAFPLERFPPALFQLAAYSFERVAYYVGYDRGESHSAARTWDSRKGELTMEIVNELRSVAEQYQYIKLESLLESITTD
jgi:hypothetical protein